MAVIAVMVLEAAPAERRAMAEFPATDVAPAPAAAEPTEAAPAAEGTLVSPLPEPLPRPLPAALELSLPTPVDRGTPVARDRYVERDVV